MFLFPQYSGIDAVAAGAWSHTTTSSAPDGSFFNSLSTAKRQNGHTFPVISNLLVMVCSPQRPIAVKTSMIQGETTAVKITAPTSMPTTNTRDLMFPSEVMTSWRSGHPQRSVPMSPMKIPPMIMRMITPAALTAGAPPIAVSNCPSWIHQGKLGIAAGTSSEKIK